MTDDRTPRQQVEHAYSKLEEVRADARDVEIYCSALNDLDQALDQMEER